MKSVNKRGEFGFAWLFALLVGGAILFFAIYGALKVGGTQKTITDSEIAKELSSLTDPLEAGFASGSVGSIVFNQKTRIYNDCVAGVRNFGYNGLSVSTKSGISKDSQEWSKPGEEQRVYLKYIFSEEIQEAETYYVFSKSFDFPYEVTDVIFLISKNYCFREAPEKIKSELMNLGISNIKFSDEPQGCNFNEEFRVVCFGSGSGCDMTLYENCQDCEFEFGQGTITKPGYVLEYNEDLMYAAIFSSPKIYACNVERLLYRTSHIAEILAEKADLMSARDCESNLANDLRNWAANTKNAHSEDVLELTQWSRDLDRANAQEACGVW